MKIYGVIHYHSSNEEILLHERSLLHTDSSLDNARKVAAEMSRKNYRSAFVVEITPIEVYEGGKFKDVSAVKRLSEILRSYYKALGSILIDRSYIPPIPQADEIINSDRAVPSVYEDLSREL